LRHDRRAPRACPRHDGGAGDEVTLRRNQSDLQAIELRPRVMVDVSGVELATSVLGEPLSQPVMVAPMGLLGLAHPDGELGAARAARAAGTQFVLSAMSSLTIEEVASGAGRGLWFQMYMWRDRGLVDELLDRARAAGYRTLVLTVDVPRSAGRDRDRRNGFGLPPRVTLRSLADGARKPRWTYGFVRHPRTKHANLIAHDARSPSDSVSLGAYVNNQFDPTSNWDDLAWFRERWGGPLVVKGILDRDDAKQAVSLGANAVVVSNHGGRQLDHAPSSIRALPAIVDAVGGAAETYLDSGVRRGTDVLKAMALGARVCLVGRAAAYGLAVAGEAGVRRALAILEEEMRAGLMLAGCASIHDLNRAWVAPDGHAAATRTSVETRG